ncbi:hypothetical protein EON81_05810 [bacterium]|nr:MAG: hypothetical protein EON81_05810 [bacterium]
MAPALDAPEMLRDYLDHLSGLSIGVIPADQRIRLCEETEFHLERLQGKYLAEGLDPEAAMRAAIHHHGDPATIAENFVESHFENHSRSPLYRSFGRGNFVAFGILGLAQMLYTGMLQLAIFLPSGEGYRLPLSPGIARQLLPAPLPLPQSLPELAALYAYPILTPLVCGWLIGRQVPIRAARAAALAMMPIIIYSFFVGTLMLPVTAGLVFALVQVVWWLPVTALLAEVSRSVTRERRVRAESHTFTRRSLDGR